MRDALSVPPWVHASRARWPLTRAGCVATLIPVGPRQLVKAEKRGSNRATFYERGVLGLRTR